MYVIVDNNVATEYTMAQLRADNPDIGFPPSPSDELLVDYNVYPATETAEPSYDPAYETTTYDFKKIGQAWTQDWHVVGNGVSDEDLREIRKNENAEYAQSLVDAAEANPLGTPLGQRDKEKENGRRNNRAKGIGKITADDDHLADYIDAVFDALDTRDASADSANRNQLEGWNPATGPWPQWNPGTP